VLEAKGSVNRLRAMIAPALNISIAPPMRRGSTNPRRSFFARQRQRITINRPFTKGDGGDRA
jgi:hypothetical protein